MQTRNQKGSNDMKLFSFHRISNVVTLAFAASLVASAAIAQDGPNLRNMQCSEAQSMVKTKGAVVLSSGTYTYNRYVKDAAFCGEDMYLRPAWAKTQNSKSCFVGYTCSDNTND